MIGLKEIAFAAALLTEGDAPKVDAKEVACLAHNIYHEARGESAKGQAAVAHVTLNRVKHGAYPNSICGVVYQPSQFSWTRRAQAVRDRSSYKQALQIATDALSGKLADPTKGATHFFAHRSVTPNWSGRMPTTAVIGSHTFKKMRG